MIMSGNLKRKSIKRGLRINALSIATFAGLMLFGANTANADESSIGLQTATTVDTITSGSILYLNNDSHNKYTLVTTSNGDDGEQSIVISGTVYYYTPQESTDEMNKFLVNLE
jgi:hypothetical protein